MTVITTRRRSRAGIWVALAGVAIAVAGLITMRSAAGQRAFYQEVTDYGYALGQTSADPRLTAAIAMGHWGLGILIFGAALVLIGITVQLVRR
jgi:hypothetical protein